MRDILLTCRNQFFHCQTSQAPIRPFALVPGPDAGSFAWPSDPPTETLLLTRLNGSMTPLFWVMTTFCKGHGDSRYPCGGRIFCEFPESQDGLRMASGDICKSTAARPSGTRCYFGTRTAGSAIGPPSNWCPTSHPFFGREGSATKIDYREIRVPLF